MAFRGRTDGSPPPPQAVGAANDWVLRMLAISAPEKMVGGCSPGECGGNQAHVRSSTLTRGQCGAENLGKIAVSQIHPGKRGKRKRTASMDIEGLSAPPSPVVKLRSITKGALRGDVIKKVFVRLLEPSL